MSQMEIDRNGTKIWRNPKGHYHREDGPAVEYVDGSKEWFIEGKHHREGGPAIILRGNITAKMGLRLSVLTAQHFGILMGNCIAKMVQPLSMSMGRKNGILMEKSIHLKTG